MKKYTPYIVIAVLLVSLIFSLTNKREMIIEKETNDTVFSERVETIFQEKPIHITEVRVDTFWVIDSIGNSHIVPKTQKHYKDSIYDIWVSGYKPTLDSVRFYGKTKVVTITNTITKEVYPKRTDFFLNTGIGYVDDKFIPQIGVFAKFRNDMTLGCNLGVLDKKPFYGLNFGFKINK